MAITYLKKADKTPQTGSDETRNIVADMLAKIEAGGEEVALAYGRDLDGYAGDAISEKESHLLHRYRYHYRCCYCCLRLWLYVCSLLHLHLHLLLLLRHVFPPQL